MKKTTVLAALLLALGLSFSVKAADPYTSKFQAGKWNGVVKSSVLPDLKGQKFTATTSVKGDAVTITVVMATAKGQEKEVWKIRGNQLIQTEYDAKGNVVGKPYKAVAAKGSDTEKTFNISCKNKPANKCDNNIDANNSWTIKVGEKKITYTVNGLKDKSNPKSFGQRHKFEMKPILK